MNRFLRVNFIPVILAVLFGLPLQLSGCKGVPSGVPQGMRLVWSDEFNTKGAPDATKWGYDTGSHGWGNNETQRYTDSRNNSVVRKGSLYLIARKENNRWTSARLKTKGKAEWTYGYFEIRAKLPEGLGTWPAIWMLPGSDVYGPWPRSGEIDIMEHVGFDPGTVHATVNTAAFNHLRNTQKSVSVPVENVSTQFHIYGMEWDSAFIQWYLDGEPIFRFENTGKNTEEWPFNRPFYLLLNIAIGGSWGGQRGIDPALRQAVMEIDYVRVYQSTAAP
jgi:beta-glucanase (GH16 family)